MSKWVNFAEIRQKVSLRDVIYQLYRIDILKSDGDKLVGPCPVHGGDSPRAFHADLSKNIWHCFSRCKQGGNQLDFVAVKESISIRDAALKLQDFFLAGGGSQPKSDLATDSSSKDGEQKQGTPDQGDLSPTSGSNPPLKVKLDLKGDHPHLVQDRTLQPETIELFGLGYCNRGIMRGCIAIPIHDQHGVLVAYAGRQLKPQMIRRYGKYKFPKGFRKELVLFNYDKAQKLMKEQGLILVEGFFSVIKLCQAGFANVVACMGCELSEKQAELLAQAPEVIILFDGNEAGRSGAVAIRERLAPLVTTRLIHMPEGLEPEDLPLRALRWLVNGLQALDLAEASFTFRSDKTT